MKHFALILSYDGSRYRGWQRQGNTGNTIQAKLIEVIERAFEQPVDLQGASRTDAGVHAFHQVASVSLATSLSSEEVKARINQYLPEDISVIECLAVGESFHVRHQVISKTYRYRLYESPKPDVFERGREWTVRGPLNVARMQQALPVLLGKHDFAGFTVGSSTKKTVRTIQEIRIEQLPATEGRRFDVIIRGDGFLHHMIRLIVGTLYGIGTGELPVSRLEEILNTGNRSLAILAPPDGLMLMDITYPEGWSTTASKRQKHVK